MARGGKYFFAFYLPGGEKINMDTNFIHPTSIVDEGAVIGEGTKIWHFCHVMFQSSIGKNCILGQNVFVGANVTLGNNIKVQNNVSIYSGVVCEDDVFLGPSMVFTNVINPRSKVERKNELKKTLVRQGASIGANATIICGVAIGRYAFVGAGSVVSNDVPDYALVIGNPARHTGWMSEQGAKLQFNEQGFATCELSKEKYRLNNGVVEKVLP